ncbi:MAG: cysteine desulfurase family protein [Synergistota bacterium]|nr:cysteine desulfurase family protein [Synergistota bacterium]
MNPRKVYLDHSATTPLDGSVFDKMTPFLKGEYGNPNSLHAWGRSARRAVGEAREKVASLLGADPGEMVFTGGGSEADNLALKGAAFVMEEKGKHIITTPVEHHAVLDACKWLGTRGFDVTFLPVDANGMVSVEDVSAAMRKDTILVSVMHANNEVGTIQPVEEIGTLCRERGVLFHVDGVQTAGHIPVNLDEIGADMFTMSAHKMYGPKGVGALYVRKGVKIDPIVHGGGQEMGLRSGTENTAGIAGFGAAASLAARRLADGEHLAEASLRDRLIDGVLKISDTELSGHPVNRLPFHASFLVDFIEGESMLLRLDAAGIGASSGSACTSGDLEPSYVLLAMGIPHERAHGSLRLTLGKDTSETDIDYVVETLRPIVEGLRALSPLGRN